MTRSYRQSVRAESADQTRLDILDALDKRLRANPPASLSVDLVAKDAGVARSTVYVVFGSKAGLFDAFVTRLYERAGLGQLGDAVRARDARLHLRAGLRAACEMFAADMSAFRTLFAMYALDPDSVGGAMRTKENERRAGMEYLVARLRDDNALRRGLSDLDAVTIMGMVSSFESFDRVYRESGHDVTATAELLADVAERAVCAPTQR